MNKRELLNKKDNLWNNNRLSYEYIKYCEKILVKHWYISTQSFPKIL